MTFARCHVAFDMPTMVNGAIALDLYKGSLLRPRHPSYPWFVLVDEVKIGLSATCVAMAECVDPGEKGNIPFGTLVELTGYKGLRVSNEPGFGGRGTGDTFVVDNVNSSSSGLALFKPNVDPRIAEGEATEIATLLQMNYAKFEQLSQKDQSTVYQASIKKKPWELGGKTGGQARLLLAEIHSTVARVVVAPCEGCEGSVISMGFHNTKLVYLATDDREIINLLPGGARLFLSSEKADLLMLTSQ